jgi:serine/threonine protein kinase
MSAPPPAIPPSLSTSGCEDGLGRRTLLFDREAGVILERLQLRPELGAFEEALRTRIVLANGFEDERVARVRGIERDPDGSLIVVSEFVSGSRVSDLLDTLAAQSADDATTPGVDTALGFLLEILPALAALHSTGGFSHGALAPGRIVLTPTGQVVLLDAIFGCSSAAAACGPSSGLASLRRPARPASMSRRTSIRPRSSR